MREVAAEARMDEGYKYLHVKSEEIAGEDTQRD